MVLVKKPQGVQVVHKGQGGGKALEVDKEQEGVVWEDSQHLIAWL